MNPTPRPRLPADRNDATPEQVSKAVLRHNPDTQSDDSHPVNPSI